MAQRQLESIYCDDVRMEVAGKVSFMGVYNGAMWVANFPATLPKFCIVFKAVIPNEKPIDSLTVRVFRDDQTIGEMTFDSLQKSAKSVSSDSSLDGLERVMSIQNAFAFIPFVVEAPCKIRLRAYTSDGDELKGLALTIGAPPEGTDLTQPI
jgi:hypothetical protein